MNSPLTLPQSTTAHKASWLQVALAFIALLGLVWLLLLSVDVVSTGFKTASGGASGAQQIFAFATNPLVGLMLGLFATALVRVRRR